MMDAHLRDLRYFVVVAEELSFTRAAERLYVSQPALSKQIRTLENGMRVRLFRRDQRAVTMTRAGAALLPSARELLKIWDEAQRAVNEAAAAEISVLRVGLSTSVGRGLLHRAEQALSERRPALTLEIKHVNWHDATAGLSDGEVDVALVWLPLPHAEDFRVQVVATESRWVAFRSDHWLADRTEVSFAELLDEPFLALPESAGTLREHWLATAERGERPARIGGVVSNAEETFAAIEGGTGIVLLAAGNAVIYQRPGLGVLPVTGLPPSRLAVTWRADDERPAVRDFASAVGRAGQQRDQRGPA